MHRLRGMHPGMPGQRHLSGHRGAGGHGALPGAEQEAVAGMAAHHQAQGCAAGCGPVERRQEQAGQPGGRTMSAFNEETVLSIHHWTDRLFTFKTTRDQSLRFSNGHFTMIGLRVNDKPLLRAYSIVSANYEDHLEFLSIKVPDGPLTSRLQHINVGDKIIVGRKPTGALLIDYLLPGKRLYL